MCQECVHDDAVIAVIRANRRNALVRLQSIVPVRQPKLAGRPARENLVVIDDGLIFVVRDRRCIVIGASPEEEFPGIISAGRTKETGQLRFLCYGNFIHAENIISDVGDDLCQIGLGRVPKPGIVVNHIAVALSAVIVAGCVIPVIIVCISHIG